MDVFHIYCCPVESIAILGNRDRIRGNYPNGKIGVPDATDGYSSTE
jgi:hypothetical protein